MVSTVFASCIKNNSPIILDGGLATELESQGLNLKTKLWSAQLLLDNQKAIVTAHLSYLSAGAQIITTASYQASIPGLVDLGLSKEQAKRLILRSVKLAVHARSEHLKTNPMDSPLVAASIGPYGAYLADGSEYRGQYGISSTDLIEFHQDRIQWLDKTDIDVLACETIPSFQEAQVLNQLLLNTFTPSWVSFSCIDESHISDGTHISDAVKIFKDNPNVLAVGVNCTSPEYIDSLILKIRQAVPDKAIIVYPNSGETYEPNEKNWNSSLLHMDFTDHAIGWRDLGASIIGGCCRIGPLDIFKLARGLMRP